MEKFGVVIDDEKSKTASTEEKCPKCGGPIRYGAMKSKQFPWCESCGTEPFEKQTK
jgi:predicted RNA-binding Zn-ribbon protein involved in translation (DUF1610 family)